MFSQLDFETSRKQRTRLVVSLAIHGVLLGWMLHEPEPLLLNPVSIMKGENGRVLSRIYFPSKSPDDSTTNSSDRAHETYRHQRLGHEKLTWKPGTASATPSSRLPLSPSEAEDAAKTQTLSSLGHGAPAGLSYGTLARGQAFGDEIRPALPITTSDPVVYPWQLPTQAGNEVIEITIDERGEIVNKTVLQSLGSEIDSKCLAALDNWHFHPATRNGSPIPSKQDAIFPFRPRG